MQEPALPVLPPVHMTETEVCYFFPQFPMIPCKAVGQAPAAVPMDPDEAVGQPPVAAVPMVSDKAVGQAPAVAVPMVPDKAVGQPPAVAIPTDPCTAVARRMADNFVDSCMPSVFPPADRLLIIDYAFIRLSCIIGAGI